MTKAVIIFLFVALGCIPASAQKQKWTVAQDGSGNYTSVQAAFNAVPLNNTTPVKIYIKKGIYKEKLTLDSTKNLVTLVGEDAKNTILTYNDHTGLIAPDGSVINTYTSPSFFIKANNFTAHNITFQNDAGFSAGQAVAVFAYGDELVFDHCRFLGFQDVLFCSGPNSRQYYSNCYIEGTTDFIFGPATVVFQKCHIHSKKNSHVTAASTPAGHPFGFVFMQCRLTADSSLHMVSLGRPWRPYASVTYIKCRLGNHIIPEGWNNWKNAVNENTARFAEYKSTGPGANVIQRAKWARQLSAAEVKKYTVQNILSGADHWNPVQQLKN